MGIASLRRVLEATAGLLKPVQPHYSALFGDDGVTPKDHFPHWLVDPVTKEIDQTDELKRLLTHHLNTLSSSGKISAWHIAQAATQRLLLGVTPDIIISDLVDLARTHECDSQTYVGLYGGGISERIDVSDGVAVMPATMAPKTFARQLVFGIDRWDRPIFQKGLPTFWPNLAILISRPVNPLTEEINLDGRRIQSLEESILRAIRALTLAGGCALTRSWQISWLNHPAIPYEGISGYAATGTLEETPKLRLEEGQPVDASMARDLYAALDTLPADVAESVWLATDRLRRSRVHAPSADTALDLGVASEIILLHSAAESELSYRFALRGAYLISTDHPDRTIKFEAFRAMYQARSRAAHRGRLEAKHIARLPEFDWLCRKIICEIIDRRAFPNWETVVLGGYPETGS